MSDGNIKVGANIRRIRKAKSLTLEQIAAAARTDTGNLSRLERGLQGYTDDGLRLIAKALGVSIADLFAPDGGSATVERPLAKYRETDDLVRVSVLETGGSMGRGTPQLDDDVVLDKVELNSRWVRSHLPDITAPGNLSFITGYGDSMEDTFFDGDVLFVDRGVNEIRVDAVYVFSLSGELFIKRLQRLPGGTVKVISDNRKYESYVIGETPKQDLRVLGRVVGAWNWNRL